MLGLLSAVSAMIFYLTENTVLESKLSEIDSVRLFIYFYFATIVLFAPLVIVIWLLRERLGVDFTPPNAMQWKFIFICVVVEFFADIFWFKAYNLGASVEMTVTVIAMTPAFAVIVESVAGGEMPSFRKIIGCALAPLVIYLVNSR